MLISRQGEIETSRAVHRLSLTARSGAMPVVLFEKHPDVQPLELCGLDEIEEGAQLLRFHMGEPVKIILTDAGEDWAPPVLTLEGSTGAFVS